MYVYFVVADPRTGGQMIIELPHPACALRAPWPLRLRMTNARSAFFRACGVPGEAAFTSLRGTATIRGVGFLDFLHGQRGHPPNGIELHPRPLLPWHLLELEGDVQGGRRCQADHTARRCARGAAAGRKQLRVGLLAVPAGRR